MANTTLLFARILKISPDTREATLDYGAVLVKEGVIAATGGQAELAAAHPNIPHIHLGERLLSPAFVDCHTHFPQTRIIASWGKRLIDWLNDYTFPEEARFHDAAYARAVAEDYLDLLIMNGTGTAAAFCTSHPESVDALFTAADKRGMRMTAGKVMMDRNAPDTLLDTAQSAYDQSRSLIERWEGVGRLSYAITPRFAPTSTPEQLELAGALWREFPNAALQTHLSEQIEEITWVKALFLDDADYLGIYERFGLVGPGAIMGHAIHLTPREKAALKERGAGVAHCPTSNTFIGSGLCDVRGLLDAGIKTGLATDVGGGSSFSMLATMRSAYEVGQLRGAALTPAELWWLATEGAAETMRLDDKVGRIAVGMEADLIALDPGATPVLAQRAARAESAGDLLFALLMLGDDRAVSDVWIAGKRMKGAPGATAISP